MDNLIPVEINGWRKEDKRATYDRDNLFDYIDGAAELYLAYDFRELLVQNFVKADRPDITVELYEMGSSDDAFGIFMHDQEGDEIGIGQGSEYGSGWLRFWKGNFFVSVFAPMETKKVEAAILGIGRFIATAIETIGTKPRLLSYLPVDGLMAVRYFHRYEILNHHYFVANQNILGLGENTEAILAQYQVSGGEPSQFRDKSRLLIVKYPNAGSAEIALSTFLDAYMPEAKQTGVVKTENGKWTAVTRAREFLIVVFDALTQAHTDNLISKVRSKLSADDP